MMAMLAALGAGYMGHKAGEKDRERQDKKDARDEEEYQFKKSEREQAKADRDALKAIGTAKQNEAYTPEQGGELDAIANAKDAQGNPYYAVGNDSTGKYTVTPNFQNETGAQATQYAPATIAAKGVEYLGKRYEKSLTDGEASTARRSSMADLAAQGNVLADQAHTRSIQAETGQLVLDQNTQAVADKAVKKRIDGFKTPEDMALFMSESPADKEGGSFKAQARYSPDKKTFTFDKVNPDGTLTPTGKVFDYTPEGMEKAKMTLAGYMTPEQRIAHYQFEETKAEAARHNKAMEGVAQQNANTQEQYRKDQAAHLRETTARLTANAKAADAPPTWSKDADEHIVKLNTIKNAETNREELDGNGAQFMQAVALDVARKNGGNTMAAISRAAEVDAALKAMSKGDVNMLVQLRAKALAEASGRPAAPQAAAPTANATPATAAAPQPRPVVRPQAIAAQGFNEAGYTDVQSTIEGAKRGDKKALAFFDVLVKRGETTPGQRQQMANLNK